jgi:hypothetical protein
MFSRAFAASSACDHLLSACLFCTDQRPAELFGQDWGRLVGHVIDADLGEPGRREPASLALSSPLRRSHP